MADYLHYFNDISSFEAEYYVSDPEEVWVSATLLEGEKRKRGAKYRADFTLTEEKKREWLKKKPLTFEIEGGGVIRWKAWNTGYTVTLEYSKNGGEWTSITSNTGNSAPSISVVSGDVVQFRCGSDGGYATMSSGYAMYNCFSATTAQFKLKGNVMSLIDSTNFSTLTTLETDYTFYYLFTRCGGLRDASQLVLPATTLSDYCYSRMFSGCIALTTAPSILPATTLANNCYSSMFAGCTSLTQTPELPATTLVTNCYSYMFEGCTSLTQAPELPATTLANGCYFYMFQGCSSLTTAPELPATTLASNCYNNMFRGCSSLTTAPELPATTLASYCYNFMFDGCRSLNYIKAMFTTTPGTSYTNNWVSGVASSGTFVKNEAAEWDVTGANGIPTGWTVEKATA